MLLALAACILAAAAFGQVYKWTDSTGKTHYGDRPPEGTQTEKLKLDVRSHEGPAQVSNWAAVIRKKSPEAATAKSQSITMYSTSWCPHCKRAKAYFAERGIAYDEIDIEANEKNRREFKEAGGGGVPLIIVGDKAMRGFDPQGMDALLKRS
jgi:glutaredoxin-like YruB-family protein